MRSFLFKNSANIEIAKYESDRQSVSESRMSNDKLASQLINTNRAEGRGANVNLFYLNSSSNFIVTRVIPLHEV